MKKRVLAILTAFALLITGVIPSTAAFADDQVTPAVTVNNLSVGKAGVGTGMVASWANNPNAQGYELQISLANNFSNPTTFNLAKGATNKNFMGVRLLDGHTYYVRIRAKGNNPWSPTRSVSVTTTTTGVKDSNVQRITYFKDNLPATGEFKFDGNKYYFENGKLKAETALMWSGVKNAKSKTRYLVITDCRNNWTYIYTGSQGHWNIYKRFRCTTGADKTPTPKVNKLKPGGNKIKFSGYNAPRKRKPYTCWFASRFQGSCFYHSVLYWRDSAPRRIMSGKLGASRSHGCIRLALGDAIWMYRNIKKGTRIITFSKKIPKPR